MGEPSKDKRGSTTESTKDKQRAQGWIRIHSDEMAKAPLVDKPQDEEPPGTGSQMPSDKIRKLEKPIESSK